MNWDKFMEKLIEKCKRDKEQPCQYDSFKKAETAKLSRGLGFAPKGRKTGGHF